jgi:hypothetical protein
MTRPSSEWVEITKSVISDAEREWQVLDEVDWEGRRRLLASLLRQLTDGFRELGVQDKSLAPLQALNMALFDLSNGVRSKLFQIDAAGREPTPARDKLARLYAVALVEWMKRSGVPVRFALDLVAKEYGRVGHRSHNGSQVTWSVVRKWRENALQSGDNEHEQRLVEAKIAAWKARHPGAPTNAMWIKFAKELAVGSKSSLKP